MKHPDADGLYVEVGIISHFFSPEIAYDAKAN
jgi:hypothetical protein